MDFGLGSQSTPSDEFKQCSPEYLVDLQTTWCGLRVKGTGGYPPVNKLGAVCGCGGFSRRQEPLTACHRYSAPREDIVDPGGVRIRRRGGSGSADAASAAQAGRFRPQGKRAGAEVLIPLSQIFLANLLGMGQLREVRLHVTLAYPRDHSYVSLSYSWKLRKPSTHRPINPATPRVAASTNRMLNKELL